MKKFILLFTVLLVSFNTIAQDKITEGKVLFKQYMSTDNEQMKAHLASVGEIVVTTYFKKAKSRTELNSVMTGENVTIVDRDKMKGLVLSNNPMMGKSYIEVDLNETPDDVKVEVEELDSVKKVIGYNCKIYKVKISGEGGDVEAMIYATDELDIAVNKSQYSNKVQGFPLYTIITMNQMGVEIKVTMEATEIVSEAVSDDKFNMEIPEGYTKI